MGKLSEKFTERELMLALSKLGGIFCAHLEYDESVEACRKFIQDDLELDEEQQGEMIDRFEQEIDEPYFMNNVRKACGIPEHLPVRRF